MLVIAFNSRIHIQPRTLRSYPLKEALAPVTGYLSAINEDDTEIIDHPNYRGTHNIGRAGLERSMESLHGQTGFQAIETNVKGEKTNFFMKVKSSWPNNPNKY